MVDSDRPSPLEPGYRIDRYELLYAVAQGGMGSVWVARLLGKHGFEKLYAIKTILPQYASDPKFRTMFLDEARIASGIDHANVVQVLDLGEQQGILYTVMEWLEGDSLHRLARLAEREGERVPLPVILRILADTCGGLHAAHELADGDGRPYEIVHRDVSPQNILVSTSGSSKLIDFGVAKARDRLAGETSEAVLKGKVRYVAIEQILGHQVDRRADIWSMGAVLHTVLAGSCPFPGESDVAILRNVLSGVEPNPPPAWVPPPVASVVARCLQRDPARRFATAIEMKHALEAAMETMGRTCSSTDVGAYVAEVTKERIASRKSSLQIARRAVADRQRVRELLEQQKITDSSGSDVAAIAREAPLSGGPLLRARTPLESVDEVATRADFRPGAPIASTPAQAEVTSAEASISLAGLRAPGPRARWPYLVGVVVVMLLASFGVAVVALQARHRASAAVPPGSDLSAAAATTENPGASPVATTVPVAPSATVEPSAPVPIASAASVETTSPAPRPSAAPAHRTPSHAAPKGGASTRTAASSKTSPSEGGLLGGTIDSRK